MRAWLIPAFLFLGAAGAWADDTSTQKTFQGYACTKDCSGHKAGYAWAEKKGITDPATCGGTSNSFHEGCRAWVQEHGKETDAPSPSEQAPVILQEF